MPNYIIWPDIQSCRISSVIFEQRSQVLWVQSMDVILHVKHQHTIKMIIIIGKDLTRSSYKVYVTTRHVLQTYMLDCQDACTMPTYSDAVIYINNQLLPLDLHLIGDVAYPLLPNLMTLFRDTRHLSRQQIIYNMKLAKIRCIIERAFGLLKCKFRRLYFLHISDFELGQKMIAAACILHNFMINRGEIDVEENEIMDNEIVLNNVNNVNENEMDDRDAIVKRNTLMYLLR